MCVWENLSGLVLSLVKKTLSCATVIDHNLLYTTTEGAPPTAGSFCHFTEQGRRKHLKTSPAMGVVNGCGIELMEFKRTRINVNKIDHTHGSHCANEY